MLNVGIIGCGLIGNKRLKAILGSDLNKKLNIKCVCDSEENKAKRFAEENHIDEYTTDAKKILLSSETDIVIIATPNCLSADYLMKAIQTGKHVLVEKPAALCSKELEPAIDYLKEHPEIKVKVGFNHRYHPAIMKAKQIVNEDDVGKIMFIRGRYGHGGRVGYDKEWRADPKISGGGELIDQGVHLIDLSRFFMGDFINIDGFATTYFWDMPVDDNGFMLLRTSSGRAAWLQVSCTEWKNMFSFEIYCEKAKLDISGLGGSYGIERLAYYKMLPQMGPPETTIFEYPRGDNSWELEIRELLGAIESNGIVKNGDLYDGYEALKIVDKIYGK